MTTLPTRICEVSMCFEAAVAAGLCKECLLIARTITQFAAELKVKTALYECPCDCKDKKKMNIMMNIIKSDGSNIFKLINSDQIHKGNLKILLVMATAYLDIDAMLEAAEEYTSAGQGTERHYLDCADQCKIIHECRQLYTATATDTTTGETVPAFIR